MSEPLSPYLRRGEAVNWLSGLGIDAAQFEKLVAADVIERITFKEKGRGYYLKSAIEEHILKPFRDAEARLASRRHVAAQPNPKT